MSRRYRKRKNNGRGFISAISYLTRQLFLPNPFTNIFEDPGNAEIANCILGGIFIPLAYLLTGTWYVSGRNEKWVGSLGFLINYFILTELLLLISKLISDICWIIGIFTVSYLILCYIEARLLNR